MKRWLLYFILLALFHSNISMAFDSPEHNLVGSTIPIRLPKVYGKNIFLAKDIYSYNAKQPVNIPYFFLPNETGKPTQKNSFTYGELNALAGDYFANFDEPVSLGKDLKTRTQRAIDYVYTLLYAPNIEKRLQPFMHKIREDSKLFAAKLKSTHQNDEYHFVITRDNEEAQLFKNEFGTLHYLLIEVFRYDHFHATAVLASEAVHNLAMQVAKKASGRKTGTFEVKGIKRTINVPYGVRGLTVAYEINAMGNHFLEDSFASGHAASPFQEMVKYDKPTFPFDAMLILFQHNEDNHFGVKLYSKAHPLGWVAYGDGQLFYKGDKKNLAYLEKALRLSVNQVYDAYAKGVIARVGHTKIAALEPNMVRAEGIKHEGNAPTIGPNGKGLRSHHRLDGTMDYAAPLFYANSIKHAVYARSNLRHTLNARGKADYHYHQLNPKNTLVALACTAHFSGQFKQTLTNIKRVMLAAKKYNIPLQSGFSIDTQIMKKIVSDDSNGVAPLVEATYVGHGQTISSANIVNALCNKWWWF